MASSHSPKRPREGFFSNIHARQLCGLQSRRLESAVWQSPALLSRLSCISKLDGHLGCVNTLHWSTDGRLLLSGSDDCRVCVWSSWGPDKTKLLQNAETGHRRNIFSAVFCPSTSNRQVVTCALDRQTRWTDLETGQNRHIFTSRQFSSKLAFVPGDPHCFVSAGQDGRVRLFDLRVDAAQEERAPAVLVSLAHIGGCTALAFDPTSGGRHFAASCDDPLVRTFDLRSRGRAGTSAASPTAGGGGHPPCEPIFQYVPRQLLPREGRRGRYERMATGASGLAFSADGELVVNLRGGDLYRFASMRHALGTARAGPPDADGAGEAMVDASEPTLSGDDGTTITGSPNASAATAAAATAVDATDAATDADGADVAARTADAPMDDAVRTFERRRACPRAAAHCPNESAVMLLRGTPTATRALTTYYGRVNEETFAKEVCFLNDDRYVATGGDCGRIYVWGAASGQLVYRARADSSIVNCVAPHPTLPYMAVSGIDDDIKLFGLGDSRPAALAHARHSDGAPPHLARRCMRRQLPRVNASHEYGGDDDDDGECEGWVQDSNDLPPPRWVTEEDAAAALEMAVARKDEGNEAFRRSRLGAAEAKYGCALDELHIVTASTALQVAVAGEQRRVWLNLSSVALRQHAPTAALACCEQVLGTDPQNAKALYRRAQAHLELGAYALAAEGVSAALAINPTDSGLLALRDRVAALEADGTHDGRRRSASESDDEESEEDEDDDDEDDDDEDDDEESDDDEDDDEESDENAEHSVGASEHHAEVSSDDGVNGGSDGDSDGDDDAEGSAWHGDADVE